TGVKKIKVFAGYTRLDLRDDEQPTTTREKARHILAFPAADADGEVIADAGDELTDTLRNKLLKNGVTAVEVFLPGNPRGESPLIKNPLLKAPTKTEAEALAQISTPPRPGEAPDLETARQALDRLFFNPKRYDLGRVGRYKINQRLKLKT